MTTPEDMLSVQEAAKRLGRSIEQVRRYLREGKLPGTRIGNQWFIRESAVAYRTVGYREEEEMVTGKSLRTIKDMTAEERWAFFDRVNRRREAIRLRWEREGLTPDVVEAIREERESH